MNGLALCSGIGGLEAGVKILADGYRTVGVCEWNAEAAAIQASNQAATGDWYPIWDDLSTFDGRAYRGCVDICTAGLPCQPFSSAGRNKGMADERVLHESFGRVLRESEAPVAVVENVPPFVKRGLQPLLEALAHLGYDAAWDATVGADTVGAPHKRVRFFLLAWRVSDPVSFDVLQQLRWSGRSDGAEAGEHRELGEAGVADAACGRLEGERSRGLFDGERAALRDHLDRCHGPFPPGPPAPGGTGVLWRAHLEAGGPEPTIRGRADGDAPGPSQLHALGNGVVPLAAAYAIGHLADRALV